MCVLVHLLDCLLTHGRWQEHLLEACRAVHRVAAQRAREVVVGISDVDRSVARLEFLRPRARQLARLSRLGARGLRGEQLAQLRRLARDLRLVHHEWAHHERLGEVVEQPCCYVFHVLRRVAHGDDGDVKEQT